ncbi:MAG TPA: FAD-dependent oxidoreductase [Streptosporangiaceae bacterium]|nr:FAD-dependent oxidoreductase [Streptosporangiaceae bacterium]
MTDPEHVVVAGAGLAGLRTIEELRDRGYAGRVTLVGAEARLPYDRPPLSKKLMIGELDDTTLRPDLDALDVQARLAESATGLSGGVLTTDAGRYDFDALVLATGARPVTLPGAGRQHVLRTLDDALELRPLLRPGTALAIVGAGWIGAELATAAAALGCRVTVVEAAAVPLAAALGPEVGGQTAAWYAAAGVDLRLGQGVDAVAPGGLALAGGDWLPADVVVTAVGVRPSVSWLAGSGVEVANGICVDEQLRTTVPGVFAVGDCAAFQSGRYGTRLRFEHWDVALHAPEVAAANVLGGGEAYDPVPYFWSEQFGRMVQYVGYHGGAGQLIWRGDPQDGGPAAGGTAGRVGHRWAAAWLAGDRLVALLSVNAPRDMLQGRRVISSGVPVDPARLADPQIPVRDCVLR